MIDQPTCSELDALAQHTAPEFFDDAMASHVATCDRCMAQGSEDAELDALLRLIRDERTCPPAVVDSALAAVAIRRADRPPVRQTLVPRWGRISALLLAILVALGAIWSVRNQSGDVANQIALGSEPVAPQVHRVQPELRAAASAPELPTSNVNPLSSPPSDSRSPVRPRAQRPTRADAPSAPERDGPDPTTPQLPPPVALAEVDSTAIATEQVYLAFAIVGRTQARAQATLAQEVQRVEDSVRSATPF